MVELQSIQIQSYIHPYQTYHPCIPDQERADGVSELQVVKVADRTNSTCFSRGDVSDRVMSRYGDVDSIIRECMREFYSCNPIIKELEGNLMPPKLVTERCFVIGVSK